MIGPIQAVNYGGVQQIAAMDNSINITKVNSDNITINMGSSSKSASPEQSFFKQLMDLMMKMIMLDLFMKLIKAFFSKDPTGGVAKATQQLMDINPNAAGSNSGTPEVGGNVDTAA
jgi:hypothetical protein